jgi:hypothetical protein
MDMGTDYASGGIGMVSECDMRSMVSVIIGAVSCFEWS